MDEVALIKEKFKNTIEPFKYKEIRCTATKDKKVWKVGRRELSAEEITSQVKAFELAEAILAKILFELEKGNNQQ